MTNEELLAVRDELLADIPLDSTINRARMFLESCPTTTHAMAALLNAVEQLCDSDDAEGEPWKLVVEAVRASVKVVALAEAAAI